MRNPHIKRCREGLRVVLLLYAIIYVLWQKPCYVATMALVSLIFGTAIRHTLQPSRF